jgi:hypothetical protein
MFNGESRSVTASAPQHGPAAVANYRSLYRKNKIFRIKIIVTGSPLSEVGRHLISFQCVSKNLKFRKFTCRRRVPLRPELSLLTEAEFDTLRPTSGTTSKTESGNLPNGERKVPRIGNECFWFDVR